MAVIQPWTLALLQVLYALCVAVLAIYSLHALWLLWHVRRPRVSVRPGTLVDWPAVTVQLPVYNEQHVAERLIDACSRLDYPADRLEIQVLDDSDDETPAIIDRVAEQWRARGRKIVVIRRGCRTGYKAGALAYAHPAANGEFTAVFDADFVPPPDFLRSTIPYFFGAEGRRVGFVQARWEHLNRGYSPITNAQALALDGHFAVEQEGRSRAGCLLGFNGSAGVWRRSCIDDPAVGGWQTDTLCEDLDLSYRAQLVGWRPRYLNDVTASSEIPPQLLAYKRQQFRWAKGSIQTLRKVGGRVAAAHLPLPVKAAAFVHLGNYLIHPVLLLLLLLTPLILLLGGTPISSVPLMFMASLGPPLLYAAAQQRLHPDRWLRHWAYLPVLTVLGIGVCLNNTVAVLQGWFRQGGAFLRTPKFRVEQQTDRWQGSRYRLPIDRLLAGEVLLAGYALASAYLIARQSGWGAALFMLLYAVSFGALAGIGLWQNRAAKLPLAPRGEEEPLIAVETGQPG
jgi:cellulose synthase/poly-beta-1,6-N-acetylglucosamine synthase-like glycosyltransferase